MASFVTSSFLLLSSNALFTSGDAHVPILTYDMMLYVIIC